MTRKAITFTLPDGSTLYGINNGTVDIVQPFMCDSAHDAWLVWEHAHESTHWHECDCITPQPAPVRVSLSENWWWDGTMCAQCRTFLGPYGPPDEMFERLWAAEDAAASRGRVAST